MTNEVILKKAFAKAKQNGYEVHISNDPMRGKMSMKDFIKFGVHYKFLFNHDFAKAFFIQKFTGDKLVVRTDYYLDCLSEMAREKDPIKYLEKHL